MSTFTLKELQTSRSKLLAEKQRIDKELKACQQGLKEIEKAIKVKTSKPVVSEHAILRYVERKYKIDLEEIRNAIMSEKTAEAIKTLGSGKFPIGDGLRAIVKNNVIVSVVD